MVKIKPVRVPASKNKKKFQGKKNIGTPRTGSKTMLKRRFKGGTPKSAGLNANGSDARLKIISRNRSKVVDARDKLCSLAKGSDARQKLVKIRNLKEGKVCDRLFCQFLEQGKSINISPNLESQVGVIFV